jgi:outer membrane protein
MLAVAMQASAASAEKAEGMAQAAGPWRWATTLSATPATPALRANPPSAWPDLLTLAQQAAGNRAAQAGAQAAQALSDQARATAWMPRVDATASTLRTHQSVNDVNVSTPTRTATLTATLPLWRAADRASARAQAQQAEQAQWQARLSQTTVAQDLSLAYLNAVEAAEQRRLTQAQQSLLEEQLGINERRLNAGAGTILDVLETRTRVDQSRAQVQDLSTRLASQRLVIERLTGQPALPPTGLRPLGTALPEVVPPLADALSQAASRNPQRQESDAQARAAADIAQARQAERWQPTVDAVATLQHNRQVQQFNGLSDEQNVSSRTVGLQLNWPLFTGGQQGGRVREAAALLTQAQARQDEAQAQVDASLRDAYQTLAQAHAVIAVQQEVERSASATFEAVRKAFVAGMRTNLDLLNAQQQIYTARQSLVTARINGLAAQVNILALLDQLDAAHVAPFVPLMDDTP